MFFLSPYFFPFCFFSALLRKEPLCPEQCQLSSFKRVLTNKQAFLRSQLNGVEEIVSVFGEVAVAQKLLI